MDKIYKVKKNDGTVCEMQYNDVCKTLGFIPDIGFVEITNRGTIGFSVGKPSEVKDLLSACRREGYVPSGRLEKAANL